MHRTSSHFGWTALGDAGSSLLKVCFSQWQQEQQEAHELLSITHTYHILHKRGHLGMNSKNILTLLYLCSHNAV